MQKLRISGGIRLRGEIEVQGAKNSVLPLLSACVLVNDTSQLERCPSLSDVYASMRILNSLGCSCRKNSKTITVNSRNITNTEISDSLMRQMRSSIIFLGALLARTGECTFSFPGGCELGPRPVDLHLSALRRLGAEITEEHGKLVCRCPKGLKGTLINLSFPSVGATENIMLAACTAEGETIISNAAREPEICDLADFLNCCGAKIKGAGTQRVVIEGVEKSSLHGCSYKVMPDRIAAATFLCAAAATGGEITVSGAESSDLEAVTNVLEQSGCRIYIFDDSIYINASRRLSAVSTIRTQPYPGFPTDAQPIVMACLSTAKGTGMFVEDIFENRFRHVDELVRMGADIKTEGRVAVVSGVKQLYGTNVSATDLRSGAALCVAGCAAEGETIISNVKYIDRGYDSIENSLCTLGARACRTEM